ncbi:hypothetical protein K490DRAFT_69098 [Saccharata proteae CBS 121410]|uniref:C2H2-domain containing protein second zinc finger domain-containing protein n=1 Tax=Saccharata proteae CBS 121410 TaxID=1314787 RepID=A0A9P4LS09_9PEZI|nr:hypothetical protein K490DRAFT_69098 [Saccharata proteae CBS 121410]
MASNYEENPDLQAEGQLEGRRGDEALGLRLDLGLHPLGPLQPSWPFKALAQTAHQSLPGTSAWAGATAFPADNLPSRSFNPILAPVEALSHLGVEQTFPYHETFYLSGHDLNLNQLNSSEGSSVYPCTTYSTTGGYFDRLDQLYVPLYEEVLQPATAHGTSHLENGAASAHPIGGHNDTSGTYDPYLQYLTTGDPSGLEQRWLWAMNDDVEALKDSQARQQATIMATPTLHTAPPAPVGHSILSRSLVCSNPGCSTGPFKRKYELQRHGLMHSQRGRFTCPVAGCRRSTTGNGFYRRDKLQPHLRTVHQGHQETN